MEKRAVLSKKNQQFHFAPLDIGQLEILESSLQSFYLIQLSRKIRSCIRFHYYLGQIFTVCLKKMKYRMMQHDVHQPDQRFQLRMQDILSFSLISYTMSCICPYLSFQTHPQPLKINIEVQELSTIHIFSNCKTFRCYQWCCINSGSG